MAKVKKSRQKKQQTRVDFTPMVDMMMLLITFFMLCTTLAKPQTMELSMPTNDKDVQDQDKTVTKESYTITMFLGADNQIYYVEGQIKPEDPTCLKKTTWGKDGIRKALISHVTEDGTQPILDVMTAKAKLDLKREQNPKMTQAEYDQALKDIKSGNNVDGKKIETMTVIIKATDNSNYINLVDALDEMQICSVGKYVIDKINEKDKQLLEAAHVKE
ncbi:MAG: biopolymer transporter ExbD [Prevotellaceae bacterium]|nr:biopolymer transporter ExbD [Prevotellaceae bacterium]MDO4991878.1 biopolymer transporter ExbD [Prevotellaceae bacterium]